MADLAGIGLWCEAVVPPIPQWEDDATLRCFNETTKVSPPNIPETQLDHCEVMDDLAGVGLWCGTLVRTFPRWEDDPALFSSCSISSQQIKVQDTLRPFARPRPTPSPTGYCSAYVTDTSAFEDEDGMTGLIKQPETWLISRDQLVAEVKGIYAGLGMFESKWIAVENAHNCPTNKLNDEQWQALIALHRVLLHEHHNFFLASQHPSASPALRKLVLKYARRRSKRYPKFALSSISQRILEIASESSSNEDDEELAEWLHKTADTLNRLIARFTKYWFEVLIYVFLFYSSYSEFPSGMRHLCTTMPWTIWPSLVVLWGVCWMFLSPYQLPQDGHSLTDKLEISDWVLEPLDPFFQEDPILNNQFDTALNHSETHYFNPPGQDNSQQHHSFDALPDTFGLDHPQPNVNRAPETTSMSALDFQSDRLLTIHRNENSVTTPQEASPSGICVTPMSLPVTTRSESQPNPATAGPRLVCSIPGCPQANKPFTRNSSLKRHMLRHRPSPTLKEFKCPNPGCKQAKRGFPRKDGLDRHRLKCKFRIGSYAQLTPSSSASCTSSGTLGALRPNRDASGGVIRRATSRQRAKVEGWKQEHKKRLEALEEKERECGEERARLEELACRIRELDEPDDEDLEEDST